MIDDIFNESFVKATEAAKSFFEANGEHPFNCGFAWLKIHNTHRNPNRQLKNWFKLHNMGYASDVSSGYEVGSHYLFDQSKVGWTYCQDRDVKLAAVFAFAQYLKDLGYDVTYSSRLD